MAKQLTAEDVRVSLNAHVASRGEEIHAKYGPVIGWAELQQMLEDRTCVRYPCKLEFNAAPLQPGEFAHPVAQGDKPEDGYIMYVHPLYMTQLADVPALVCYQLVLVNYGEFAASEDALTFGAAVLGISEDVYYGRLCELMDPLGDGTEPGGCSCG